MIKSFGIIFLLTYGFVLTSSSSIKQSKDAECNLSKDIIDDIASYKDKADSIINYFKTQMKGVTYNEMSDFVDKFGPRLTGSDVLEQSIDYMKNKSEQYQLENIHTEELEVPYWFRNTESAYIIEPRPRKMKILGIGFSPATPAEGITAPVVVVSSFEELNSLPVEKVKNTIVVFDEKFTTYGETVKYRNFASTEASKKDALAVMIRSVTPFSIATPHTGDQIYEEGVVQIPAVAITHEDADYLRREYDRGVKIVVKLHMSPITDTKKSRNLIADLKGSELADRFLLIGGHIDSWDVGDGSMDDAGGFFISWLAPIALKRMNLVPKRTIRSILFTAEEQGLFGAIDYQQKHKSKHESDLVFLMESDSGTFAPLGLNYEGSEVGRCMLLEILKLFSSINADELVLRSPAPDISVWTSEFGYPGVGLHNDNDKYFWFHHSEGDTLNVQKSDVMDLNSGFWTAVAYIVADMKYELPKSAAINLSHNALLMYLICIYVIIRHIQ